MALSTVESTIDVIVETGSKRVFASADGWPGWCRAGKSEELAIEALLGYGERFAPVAQAAGVPIPRGVLHADVVERLPGSATTEFGAPGAIAERDRRGVTATDAARLAALLAAAWQRLEDIATAAPQDLRKGPRGGGRDRDAVLHHVISAETAYAGKIGLREREPTAGDAAAASAIRQRILARVREGEAAPTVDNRAWPLRYAVRRMAWHVMDHAWEMEDRS